MCNAESKDVFSLVEDAICILIKDLKREMNSELSQLCRCESIQVPKVPFKIYDRAELEAKTSSDWEAGKQQENNRPVWITNTTEFYDFEDFNTGKWDLRLLFLNSEKFSLS